MTAVTEDQEGLTTSPSFSEALKDGQTSDL